MGSSAKQNSTKNGISRQKQRSRAHSTEITSSLPDKKDELVEFHMTQCFRSIQTGILELTRWQSGSPKLTETEQFALWITTKILAEVLSELSKQFGKNPTSTDSTGDRTTSK